jgi:plasmid maintenance system antidote protein VapI
MNVRERNLLVRHMAWADRTFPRETLLKVAQHLVKEVGELQQRPDSGEEHADVYLLAQRVVGLVRRSASAAGIDLIEVAEAKLLVNESRVWEPGTDGVYEHVREVEAVETAPVEPFDPDWVVHPGDVIAELMSDQNLGHGATATALRWGPGLLALVIAGEQDVKEGMAADLARVFGLTAGAWLRLQARYTEWRDRPAPRVVAAWEPVKVRVPRRRRRGEG